MPGGRGPRGKAPDWLKRQRQQQQQRDVAHKSQREVDYFWDMQESNKKYDKEKGGAPRKHWRTIESEEKELFEDKAGMAAGIDFDHYDEISVEINGKGVEDIKICETYEDVAWEFHLPEWLSDNIWRCHYSKPTPVQKYAIPTGLSKFDMMVCAQTGSGKTAAFLIPTAVAMREKDGCEYSRETWEGPASPLSLVLAPTRELCSQIYDEARKLFHKSVFKVSQCYGGVEVKPQMKDLARGCDVLIATPGRLNDFIERGVISMEWITFFTLDEADRMLDMGFVPQIRQIVEQRDMPPKSERQTLMFSATFPKEVQQLATSFLNRDYIWISVGRVGAAADTVEQRFVPIRPSDWSREGDKLEPLYKEIKKLDNLGSKHKVLVFVGMKRTASWLAYTMQTKGRIGCSEIHGDLTQPERERALAAFKSGDKPVLVATEVAARGLDIPAISLVINFDMPTQIDDYVHRIGRTGRVGNRGTAVSFFKTSECSHNDTDIAPEICQILDNAKETHGSAHIEIPEWLEDEARRSKNRHKWDKLGGGKGGSRGAGHRDHRGGGVTHKLKGGGKGKGKGKDKGRKSDSHGRDDRDGWGRRDYDDDRRGGKRGGGGDSWGDRKYGGGDRDYDRRDGRDWGSLRDDRGGKGGGDRGGGKKGRY